MGGGESQGGVQAGDTDPRAGTDAVDALLVLRHVAALPVNLPPGCGPLGPPLAAPAIERLECNAAEAQTSGSVHCDASISGTVTAVSWSAPGSLPSRGPGQVASPVWCPPDPPGGPCHYGGVTYGFHTGFDTTGTKTVLLTACNDAGCTAGSVPVLT